MQYSFVTVASALVATASAGVVSSIADGQPQAPTYASAAPSSAVTSAPVYSSAPAKDETTTEVVTHLTTVCPVGTHTYGSHTVTATAQTTVTISDCYCTVSKAVPTPVATPVASSTPVAVVPSSSAVVTQISDNQPQAPTSAPAASAPVASAPAASAPVVSQIGDNQPQAPTSAPAASAPAASAPAASAPAASAPAASAPVVSQIGDNQPQAPTSAPAASAPAASAPAASAPAASPTPSPLYTAGAPHVAASGFSFAAVLAAIAYVL